MKRVPERLLALFLLIVIFTPLLLVALIIVLNSRGSPLYRQVRIGKHERHFVIYKLRTMVVGSGETRTTHSQDPRITKVGAWLRKTRIDEWPQLLNIVLGDMTFIGPRPHNLTTDAEHRKNFGRRYTNRYHLLPGISGLTQALWEKEGRKYRRMVACDEFYRMRKNPRLNLWILWKSFRSILGK